MQTQYSVLGYRVDLYFHKCKLAIEVDELGHPDRNINNKIEWQRALERQLNPDERGFSMFREINRINRHINQLTIQQTKQQTKESVINYLSKIVKNILPGYKKF